MVGIRRFGQEARAGVYNFLLRCKYLSVDSESRYRESQMDHDRGSCALSDTIQAGLLDTATDSILPADYPGPLGACHFQPGVVLQIVTHYIHAARARN